MRFLTGAQAEAMRIDSSGNVGIGTSSPQSKLVVSNAGAAGIEFFTNYPGGGVGTYIQSYNRSGAAYVNTAYDALSHSFRISSVEKVVIDSSGNVGIGTTANASAILDAQSTTKGVRMPNMTTTQKNAIASPAAGLMVFDTTLSKLAVYSGSAWQTVTSV
jgi:hypothetical protein